jgi:hypothetical protein
VNKGFWAVDLRRVVGLLAGMGVGALVLLVLTALGVSSSVASFVALPIVVGTIVKVNERVAPPT